MANSGQTNPTSMPTNCVVSLRRSCPPRRPSRLSIAAAALAVSFLSPALVAQVAPAIPASTRPESDASAPIALSPFEVSTSKDVGFVAASSLAGGRLAGELRDTPAAYSVLTREFIDALGLIDLSAAS